MTCRGKTRISDTFFNVNKEKKDIYIFNVIIPCLLVAFVLE